MKSLPRYFVCISQRKSNSEIPFSNGFIQCKYLKQSGEDVKLKDRNMIITSEVNCWFQSHGLHSLFKIVSIFQMLLKQTPLNYAPECETDQGENLIFCIWKAHKHMNCMKDTKLLNNHTFESSLWIYEICTVFMATFTHLCPNIFLQNSFASVLVRL